jgi:hypothetical protein
MRFRLALGVSAMAAALVVGAPAANAAIGNAYTDGNDAAVDAAAPANFRLNLWTLEPGCYPASRYVTDRHIDIGDDTRSAHITVLDGAPFSVDQVLVPGKHTGYAVYDRFDTGTVNNDPDIDPNQTATNLDAPQFRNAKGALQQDDVDYARLLVCVSDHEDGGQNEPYAHSDGGANATQEVADANEVYAKNRPIIQPEIATLGQGAADGVAKTYKMGLGYSVERWYTADTITDVPAFTLPLTDPMGFGLNPVGNPDPDAHVVIPPRIAGPRFDAVHDGPGVLRVNDVDVAGEEFADPHLERSDYGQTDVFNVAGDPRSFCLGGPCAGIVSFGTQGDLPVTWSLKASLAAVDTLRSVSFTPAQFDAWEQGWQDYYCGKGPHPTLPLTPGTNSPDPRDCPVIVNPPESRPAPTAATPNPTVVVNPAPVVVQAPAAAAPNAAKKVTAKQRAAYKRCVKKANKKHGKSRSKARAKCARLPH